MSEEAPFLAALKANPADDTARRVYADWLDEHDEPAKAEDAAARAELNRDIVLETGLTLQEARNRRAVIQQHFPAYEASRGWYLWLYRRDSAPDSP